MRWLSWLIVVAFLCATPVVCAAANDDVPAQQSGPPPSPVLEKLASLTPDAAHLAEHMGIAQVIHNVETLRAKSSEQSLELVQAKQTIMQAVLIAMLQVRAASAQISYDVFEAAQVSTALENRRDRALKFNSIANFVSGGIAELGGGSFQLVDNFPIDNAGNIIEMAGGAIQTGLSTMALAQERGQRRGMPLKPNMLAPIFDQTTNQESKYPRVVWQFLNEPIANTNESRRTALLRQWLQSGRLPGRQAPYIAALTGNGGKRYPVTIDILSDRMAMLTDVNALVSRIERLLLEILLYSDVQ